VNKASLILLLVVYGIATLGIGITRFYCCGKLKSTSINLAHEQKQKCGGEGKTDGCCKTKYQSIKVKDNHVAGEIASIPSKHFVVLHLLASSFEAITLVDHSLNVANASHAPPLKEKVPIYILNCVYRI
jgi:hypothetical protein